MTARTALNATRRAEDLAALDAGQVVDVLVVGGGVTGAGVAMDAAARGLTVAIAEAEDLAFGTSRWSSKLVHGGLRYLANGDVGLAHESAVERGVLMTATAPHLTRALPQLVPLHPAVSGRDAAVTFAGLLAGDGLRRAARTPSSLLPRPRRVSAPEAMALAPGLRRAGLRGGLLSFDGQLVDDARLVVALARTAAGFGARVLTQARVTGVTGTGAEIVDGLTGRAVEVRARAVVNAAGVWAGELVPSVRLRPSRGSHLVLDGATLGAGATALTVPIPGAFGRFALVLPQEDGRVYVGLTDEPVDGPIPAVPTVPESDVDFLLTVASSALERTLTRADVLGAFAGLRPLVDSPVVAADSRSADLSRNHAVLTASNGVITVVGGKLTTYRRMAADAVDAAIDAAGLAAGPSRTRAIPLVGAAPRARLSTVDAPARLVSRYGTEAATVHALGLLDPELAAPIAPGCPVTAAEVVWAVRNEGALTPADVLHRRTRIGLVAADEAAAAPAVTALVERTLRGLTSSV
ncbi:glycerol-3-phosphate dehydrogenase/oxidase [Actinokineospora iranica]|uniref:Glycerol-3-phosphate dehydrogenase n=1 Tax=Actinokineospora iranica TaxID=1271860 RepID=A0A1G6TKX6_9PSEU|nr:glycerol-3-phosphate dehydrogenase/oxidase [Actinokineospora iranica]SDD28975.1 glycerol-3-phosphate dehydrogenase [Actinokineospora iranica]